MANIFYLNLVRKNVIDDSHLMVQGLCNFERMEDKKFVAFLKDKGEKTRLKIQGTLNQIPIVQRQSQKLSGDLLLEVALPEKLDSSAKLELYVMDYSPARQADPLITISGSQIIEVQTELNGKIDEVKETDDGLLVRGWVVGAKKESTSSSDDIESGIQIELIHGNERRILHEEVEWYFRQDALDKFKELKEKQDAGFRVLLPSEYKDAKLYVHGGDKSITFRILDVVNGSGTKTKLTNNFNKTIYNLKNYGVKVTAEKIYRIMVLRKQQVHNYKRWIEKRMPNEKDLEIQRQTKFDYNPKFSILVPLYETEERYLDELIVSIKKQTYENWEICFSDGSKDSTRLKKIVGAYSAKDERIKYTAEEKGPLGISANTNQAYTIAKGDYIVLGDHDDLFTPDALFECVKALNEEKVDVIYTDEDKVDAKSKTFFGANFKPDFNIDLLCSNNYICHMFVAAKSLIEQVGVFRDEFDGAQDYDFILRCVEKANGIKHIPKVLYRWRSHQGSTAENPEAKLYAFEAGKRAVQDYYDRIGAKAKVEHGDNYGFYKTTYEIVGEPLVSIVIPNKDHIDDLKKCMDSIDNRSDYRNYEYVIIENNSEKEETFAYYKELEKRDNVQVVYWDKEFNYSAINNYGVQFAKGEYIWLLNNDTEIINKDCLSQMLGYCQREDVGIVGARLYYEDGSIQHAGVVVGFGGIAGHAFVTLREEDDLYQSRTKVACDYSAVTAACLMIRKSVFEEVGGLEEQFKVAFNDIDFCMKVRETGRLVVYNPNAKLYHYESKSRGLEDTPEKKNRFKQEIDLFAARWPKILNEGDPYYNINLTLDKADFSLRP